MSRGRVGSGNRRNPLILRTRNKRTRVNKRSEGAWERDLGLAPGEQCAESFVAYLEPGSLETGTHQPPVPKAGEVDCEFAEAFGLRERGELVNAVFTDRGRLVLRMPNGITRPIAFDAKRPAAVAVLGPTERRLTGSRNGAERTQLVEISSRGTACVRIIVPESGVDALLRWGSERAERADRWERVSA